MNLSNPVLALEDIRLDVLVLSRPGALDMLSQSLGSRAALDARAVFDALWAREPLGSTEPLNRQPSARTWSTASVDPMMPA